MSKATAETVTDIRSHYAALRRLASTGGGTAATTNAVARHRDAIDNASRSLPRSLAGDLAHEATLLKDIAASRRNGVARPELAARLANCRLQVRSASV